MKTGLNPVQKDEERRERERKRERTVSKGMEGREPEVVYSIRKMDGDGSSNDMMILISAIRKNGLNEMYILCAAMMNDFLDLNKHNYIEVIRETRTYCSVC